jgi:phosphoribosylformimino-5-aminoimidazole carboxamide ribotide isomerase
MHVIPVIDLKNGQVVRAAGGDRRAYQPWRSPICPDAEAAQAVAGFRALFPFAVMYVADLDAIEHGRWNSEALDAMRRARPDVEFWLDGGSLPALDGFRPVIGSESIGEQMLAPDGGVLSLDFRNGAFLGPPALIAAPETWPCDVIVMSLDSVGAGAGPDLARLGSIRAAAPKARVYAAGGVRNAEDLQELAELGVAGALVASALHSGAIDANALRTIATK